MTGADDTLPSGWVVASLEDLLIPLEDGRTLHHGWSPQCEKEPSHSDDEWGVLKTTAIQPGAFLPEHNKKLPENLSPRPQHEVKQGDLLITCAGPRVRCGIPCLVRSTRPRLMLSGKMYRFRVSDKHFDARYLEKYLLSHSAQTAIEAMKTGGSDSGLNLTHDRFKPLPVPVAPLNEQRRIASKIDELFSRIEEGERALQRVQKLVERYRQSVLKAAVTGELTRDWREKNKGKLESSEALLARILKARREAWEKAELAKMKAKGVKPANDKWKQKYKEPAPPDTTDLPELPEGWLWTSLEQLAYAGPTNGYSPKSDSHAIGTLSLKLTATTSGTFRLDDEATKRLHEVIESDSPYWLAPGDLLIQRANSLDHVGVAAIYAGPPETYVYPDLMMRVRVHDERVRRWMWRHINSRAVRRYFQKNATGTAGSMPKIGGEVVRRLAIPLPSDSELDIVLSRLEQGLGAAEAQVQEIKKQARKTTAIRQSILRSAFSGSLVQSDKTDEPAATLLERIATERGATSVKPKRGRKRESKQPA